VSLAGLASEEVMDDMTHIESITWKAVVKDYWTLLTPLIFSDNPKRPGDDDPLPPSNLVRNVMDMNAGYGDFNAALLLAGKPVWVMNVIPTTVANTLPIVYDRGLVGIMHDWSVPHSSFCCCIIEISFCTVEEKLPPRFLHNHGSQTCLSQKTASDFAPGVKHFQHIQGRTIWCTVLICCHLNSIELGPVVLLDCSLK
jgi:hypothetical protein